MDFPVLTPALLLEAYCSGAFPMAESAAIDAPIHFYRPTKRTLFTVQNFHVPQRLQRTVKQQAFTIKFPDNLHTIMHACGENRDESWINPVLLDHYAVLAQAGFAAALGIYQDETCVGGIYWVQIGTAIMAESMFSRVTNASKIALVSLMAAIRARQDRLNLPPEQSWIDVQYNNPHLEQFHPTVIGEKAYQSLLDAALGLSMDLSDSTLPASLAPSVFLASDFSAAALLSFLQLKTQIS
jgi:leucyl/phenylalanyl-tRNA--protein transferase